MTSNDWTQRQVQGAVVVVAAVVILYAAVALVRTIPPAPPMIPYGDESWGPVVAEFSGHTGHEGIYFLPDGATVADLLRIAGVAAPQHFDPGILSMRLRRGQKLVATDDHRLAFALMHAAARIRFDVPLDVNAASFEELLLVPGIGKVAAGRILAARQELGGFSRMEDLMQIEGIKEKRLAQLRWYLTAETKSRPAANNAAAPVGER
jgi:competence protein ComEA